MGRFQKEILGSAYSHHIETIEVMYADKSLRLERSA